MRNFDELFYFYLVWFGIAIIFFIAISIYQSVYKYFNIRQTYYSDYLESFLFAGTLSVAWPITLLIGTAFVIWKSVGYLVNWILTTYERLHQDREF
jgi:hypothetical protein